MQQPSNLEVIIEYLERIKKNTYKPALPNYLTGIATTLIKMDKENDANLFIGMQLATDAKNLVADKMNN